MNPLPVSQRFNDRFPFGCLRCAPVAILSGVLLLLGAANASAATRYAAPGGTNSANSGCPQATPCSLLNAADRFVPGTTLNAGDEIVVEPGNYDLGPQEEIIPQEGTSIHGVAGEPRPVITFHGTNGADAFRMDGSGDALSRLEIITTGRATGVALTAPSTVDGVVVRANQDFAACEIEDGLIRNTACLSTSENGLALQIEPNNALTDTVKLRNVTAIATGANSLGLEARAGSDVELNVDAIGVLARGTSEDVLAGAFSVPPNHTPGTGATVTVNLDHSDFTTIKTENDAGGGTATITAPGTGTDITAEPLLAADGYHELAGSLTIDAGAIDASSGTTDIDGNQRVIGLPDIGADEFQLPTTTSVSCAPASVVVGDPTSCTATVSSSGASPQGTVKLTTNGPGAFANAGSCSLAASGNGQASCHLPYMASAVGSSAHRLSASYGGDAAHSASEGSTSVLVAAAGVRAPNTTLKRKPARKSAAHQATFTFLSDQAGSRFECKLDKGHFKPCRSPFKAKKLKRGRHSFNVRAISGAGLADPTPAVFRWKVS